MSDREGRFIGLQLPSGRYTVTFKLSGFATLVQEASQVNVGQSLRLTPMMRPSGLAETVTVTARRRPSIPAARAAATTLDETTIGNTPILGRKFEDSADAHAGRLRSCRARTATRSPSPDSAASSTTSASTAATTTTGSSASRSAGSAPPIDITLDAVKEFQVVATGANAEFGRTAGGVVNVITKSGTNQVNGSLFHFQRLEGLTSNTSDGKPLTDFHREQFGGTAGGPVVKNKVFYFGAIEGIREHLLRPNLSDAIGTPCPVAIRRSPANEALINASRRLPARRADQLLQRRRGQDEGQPVRTRSTTRRRSAKIDWATAHANNLSVSYNFDYSKNHNQTFDVVTYGDSANGTEGPSKINLLNLNLFTTVTPTKLNEFHITVRENRGRARHALQHSRRYRHRVRAFVPLRQSVLPRDRRRRAGEALPGEGQLHDRPRRPHRSRPAASGCTPTTRRCSAASSRAATSSTASPGSSATPLRPPPGGFGPNTHRLLERHLRHRRPPSCPAGTHAAGGPLLFYLQSSSPDGIARDAAGASDINNEEFSLFIQDKWHAGSRPDVRLRLSLGRAD